MSIHKDEPLKGPVDSIILEVAEFTGRGEEYIEGPRLLAETVLVGTEGRTETIRYYGNGVVHSRVITTNDTQAKKSTCYRYGLDGILRDRVETIYDAEGKACEAYQYDADGRFMRKHACLEVHPDSEGDFEVLEQEGIALPPDESFEYEFDAYGNWVKETKFMLINKANRSFPAPSTVTYRTIKYRADT